MGKIADRFAAKRNNTKSTKTPRLVNAYWGYHPRGTKLRSVADHIAFINNQPLSESHDDRGCFEFTTAHLCHAGLPKSQADDIIQTFYQAVRDQIQHFERLSEFSKQAFLDEEQDRLDAVIADFDINGRRRALGDMLPLMLIGCCAISTLVYAGRLVQDELNGDMFMWERD